MNRQSIGSGLAIAGVFLLIGVIGGRPAELEYDERRAAEDLTLSVWFHAVNQYGLEREPPRLYWGNPAEYGHSTTTMAFADCFGPNTILFSEAFAAGSVSELELRTIPHEVAHLVVCEVGNQADNLRHQGQFVEVRDELEAFVAKARGKRP